jgi:hypothetical protein
VVAAGDTYAYDPEITVEARPRALDDASVPRLRRQRGWPRRGPPAMRVRRAWSGEDRSHETGGRRLDGAGLRPCRDGITSLRRVTLRRRQ